MRNLSIEMPQEIEVWYLLPAIRRELVKEMFRLDLKQKDIAAKLRITEAAVSQYLGSKRAKKIRFDREVLFNIKKSVKNILDGGNVTKEILDICKTAKKNLTVCRLHRQFGASKTCEACFK